MKNLRTLLLAAACLIPVVSQADEARTALVMGAWNYKGAMFKQLPGIDKDVERMSDKLTKLGFEVIRCENPNLVEAERAIDQFGSILKAKKGVGLFYFSGHGAELQGGNYLIPVGIDRMEDKSDLKVKALNAQLVLNRMSAAQSRINLVFLDCCRNEATKAATDTGLAPMSAKGVFVGFATASGATAAAGMNGSPYTSSLLTHMEERGLEIKAMHTLVTRDVMQITKSAGDEQSPFESASLSGSFYFVPGERAQEDESALRARIESEMRAKIEDEVKRRVDDFKEKNGVALTTEQMQAMIRAELEKASKPVVNKPQPRQQSPSKAALARFVQTWWEHQNSDSAGVWAGDFRESCGYCYADNGTASRAFIRNDRAKLIGRYPQRFLSVIDQPQSTISADGRSATVQIRYAYQYRGTKFASGQTKVKMELDWDGDSWGISDYNESVVRD